MVLANIKKSKIILMGPSVFRFGVSESTLNERHICVGKVGQY